MIKPNPTELITRFCQQSQPQTKNLTEDRRIPVQTLKSILMKRRPLRQSDQNQVSSFAPLKIRKMDNKNIP